MRSFLPAMLLSFAVAHCGGTTDSYVNQRGDGAVSADSPTPPTDSPTPPTDSPTPTTDSPTPPPPEDAGPPPWMPPAGTNPACVSGTTWTRGNRGSSSMNPGQACVACHVRDREAPALTAAGTVYYLDHEMNNCNGYNGTVPGGTGGAVYVELVDARNQTVRIRVNTAGNFYTQAPLTYPLMTARVIGPTGARAEMGSAVPNGDCNSCHTQMGTTTVAGADPAPGRIVVPLP